MQNVTTTQTALDQIEALRDGGTLLTQTEGDRVVLMLEDAELWLERDALALTWPRLTFEQRERVLDGVIRRLRQNVAYARR